MPAPCAMEVVRMYSIEFLDDEGETVVRHQMLTPAQAGSLMDKMISEGIGCIMYDLSGQPESTLLE